VRLITGARLMEITQLQEAMTPPGLCGNGLEERGWEEREDNS
jgi:hypothetical protein